MPSNELKYDLGVIVLSCDAYSDLWTVFFKQFAKHWSKADYNLYLACNEKSSGISDVIDAKSGPDIDWSSSLISSLQQVKEENVLIMIDDAFLCKDINHQHFLKLLNVFVEQNMDYLRLKNTPKPDISFTNEIGKISAGQLYRTALFPSIWKKEVLLKILSPGESAWEFELKGSDRSDEYSEFYGTYNDVFEIIHGVIKGKWHPDALSLLEKEGVMVDVKRPVLSTKEVLYLRFGTLRKYCLRLFPSFMRKKVRRFVYRYILRKSWFA